MKIDLAAVTKHLEAKNLTVRHHETLPLATLCYTDKCAYERNWDDVTTACRGLIYNVSTLEVASRPFRKFFNQGEIEGVVPPNRLPDCIQEKVDGSLGISYWTPDGYAVATKGSFHSDQAVWATTFLRANFDLEYQRDVTFLWEIVYPENRIVLDYEGMEDLILLSKVKTSTGARLPADKEPFNSPTVLPESYRYRHTVNKSPNTEGVVLTWDTLDKEPFMLKIKTDEYIKRHRVRFGLNSKLIFETLSSGESLENIRKQVEEEDIDYFDSLTWGVMKIYYEILGQSVLDMAKVLGKMSEGWDRAEFANENLATSLYPPIVFLIKDEDDRLEATIWKAVKKQMKED